jgi:hypothetical protein
MPALQELRVLIVTPNYSDSDTTDLNPEAFEDAWLGPLALLAQPLLKVFEVTLPRSYILRFDGRTEGMAYRLLAASDVDLSSSHS